MRPRDQANPCLMAGILVTAIGLSIEPAFALKDQAKVTLVQLTDKGDPDSVIERMPAFFEQAAAYGSDLIVFPEYVLGRNVTIEDPNVQKFFALAKKHNIYAIAGLVESHGEKWTTTALVVDRSGNLLGRYFKCHPASGPPPHWWPPVKGSDAEARGVLGNQFKVFRSANKTPGSRSEPRHVLIRPALRCLLYRLV